MVIAAPAVTSCYERLEPLLPGMFRWPPMPVDLSNPHVPSHVLKYAENDDISMFEYTRPWQRSKEKKPANEFKELWVIRFLIFTAEPFPSNRRRIPVVDRLEMLVQPIVNAIEAIVKKTADLERTYKAVANAPLAPPPDVGPLSMALNGIIDAAVNGGTDKYVEAFLTDAYLQLKSERETPGVDGGVSLEQHRQWQLDLKRALRDQQLVLRDALDVFAKRSDEKLSGLVGHLTGLFPKMVAKTEKVLANLD